MAAVLVRLRPNRGLPRQDRGHGQIERLDARGEPQIVDGLLGADQALGDLLDLARDRGGIAAVDRQLGDRLDLRLQILDLGLKQLYFLGAFARLESREWHVSRLA